MNALCERRAKLTAPTPTHFLPYLELWAQPHASLGVLALQLNALTYDNEERATLPFGGTQEERRMKCACGRGKRVRVHSPHLTISQQTMDPEALPLSMQARASATTKHLFAEFRLAVQHWMK